MAREAPIDHFDDPGEESELDWQHKLNRLKQFMAEGW